VLAAFQYLNDSLIFKFQIKHISFYQLFDLFLTGKRFDVLIVTSILEYAGLQEFNENINPWADLILMSYGWCLTQTNATALVKIPTGEGFSSIKVDLKN